MTIGKDDKLLRLFILTLTTLLAACAHHTETVKLSSYSYPPAIDSRLADYFDHQVIPEGKDTGFIPLERGHDALLARLAFIEAAEHSLDLQYYIYRDDETSQLITWRLIEAAERGVRVRLLLDDMQSRDDKGMAMLDAHPNISVRLFNPHQWRTLRGAALVADFKRLNRRMHNKALVADGITAIVGGRNIGNEYFSFESPVEFGDFDLVLIGKPVKEAGVQFDHYWNSDYAIPVDWLTGTTEPFTRQQVEMFVKEQGLVARFDDGDYDLKALPFYQDLGEKNLDLHWARGELIYDYPDKIETNTSKLTESLADVLKQVKGHLVIVSPYFVPTKEGTQALTDAVANGKQITIITNSLASNDVFAVHGWYAKYRKELVAGGIDLWEVKADANLESRWSITGSSRSSLHAKILLFDQTSMFVGSMNWDPRSIELNTEMGVLLYAPDYVNRGFTSLYDNLKSSAYQLTIEENTLFWLDHISGEKSDSEPDAGWLRRIGAWLSGLLPIENQL